MNELLRARIKLLLGRGVGKTYSQFGEDAIIGALMRYITDGFYVDIGAYHPILYSNTYALYRRGWHGIVIDPNARLAALHKSLRPRDIFIANAVGHEANSLPYYCYADGAYNTLDHDRRQTLAAEGIEPKETIDVPVRPLSDILSRAKVERIDFMNVDVEGLDLEVLESNDWLRCAPRIIAVEDHAFNITHSDSSPIYRYLSERGYTLKGLAGLTLIFLRGN